jgi:hypothetical protein
MSVIKDLLCRGTSAKIGQSTHPFGNEHQPPVPSTDDFSRDRANATREKAQITRVKRRGRVPAPLY